MDTLTWRKPNIAKALAARSKMDGMTKIMYFQKGIGAGADSGESAPLFALQWMQFDYMHHTQGMEYEISRQ